MNETDHLKRQLEVNVDRISTKGDGTMTARLKGEGKLKFGLWENHDKPQLTLADGDGTPGFNHGACVAIISADTREEAEAIAVEMGMQPPEKPSPVPHATDARLHHAPAKRGHAKHDEE